MATPQTSALNPETKSHVSTTSLPHPNGDALERASLAGTYVSEELYWEKYYDYPDISYEWNNGQLEEVPVTDYLKFKMYLWFLDILRDYLHANPVARIVGLELGFRLALPTKTTVRKPDLGLVLETNPVPLGDHDRSYSGVFDLCIESISDSSQTEVDRDAIIKRDEYALAGVQEYYILDERQIETQFYRLQGQIYQPLPRSDGIVQSHLLPGFQFRLQDLYSQPSPDQMVDDPVYNQYVSLLLRAERQRAQAAEKRAETAEHRAEEAESRADRYAALLAKAGLLPPE